MIDRAVYIGFDPREAAAFAVTRSSIRRFDKATPIHGLVLDEVIDGGLYCRQTERRDGRLWDVISDAPMSTEFAISRFLVPAIQQNGLGLFLDCDMLIRKHIGRLFEIAERNPGKAVWCVKHNHKPTEATKMDGQIQTTYPRKNWSSVMLFNCDHAANERLTIDMINSLPGRDLHRFCWLEDDEIGELPVEWNYLVGHSQCEAPACVHFTDGIPTMAGYEDCEYAGEWRKELRRWAV